MITTHETKMEERRAAVRRVRHALEDRIRERMDVTQANEPDPSGRTVNYRPYFPELARSTNREFGLARLAGWRATRVPQTASAREPGNNQADRQS
jgi:hypothetical protein